jgi:hypothetical protein
VCTLIALHQTHARYPLVVAGNRDELYGRRSTGPQLLSADPRIVGGRDLEKGGTWLGASADGFFVALTNQRTGSMPDPTLRSRGEVVLSALARPGLGAALDWLRTLDGREYNPFNLLLGDVHALWVGYARRESAALELLALPPGIWALPNDRLGSPEFPKADRAVARAQALCGLAWPELPVAAAGVLADHDQSHGPLGALCVHTLAYGTVSASLLAFDGDGLAGYAHADGPPCQAPLVDRPDLVGALRG